MPIPNPVWHGERSFPLLRPQQPVALTGPLAPCSPSDIQALALESSAASRFGRLSSPNLGWRGGFFRFALLVARDESRGRGALQFRAGPTKMIHARPIEALLPPRCGGRGTPDHVRCCPPFFAPESFVDGCRALLADPIAVGNLSPSCRRGLPKALFPR